MDRNLHKTIGGAILQEKEQIISVGNNTKNNNSNNQKPKIYNANRQNRTQKTTKTNNIKERSVVVKNLKVNNTKVNNTKVNNTKERNVQEAIKKDQNTKVLKKSSKNLDNSMGVKIIPLGGLEQIGMNITAIEYDGNIIVIDCGISFPEDEMLGIDMVIPDVTYLKDNIEKVKGFVITHGHEDHIGALPYILKEVNVPVYGTRLTIGLIENKLKEHNLLKNTKRKVVKYGQSINLGCFRIEFVRTNHSIADAAALAIYTPEGIIFHTGDFKVDFTPVFGAPIDLQRIGEIGKKGVLALLCDSTNAERPGYTMSEKTVGKTFDNIFADAKSRIIVATFASNVDRVQQIVNSAVKYKRKVVIEGRSMINVIGTASEIGYINIPDNTLIEIEQMKNYTDDQIVMIMTGSQGESMAALSRIAANIHRKVSIQPGDVVIFSSSPIPGNEKPVSKVINELSMKGAKVIYQDTHVSGHACQEEIKLMYSLLKPKYSVPVHGEYRHLIRHAELAEIMGVEKDNIFLIRSGDVLTISKEKGGVTGKVQAQGILVDGLGVGDVGNIVLRDRQHLSENGLIIVVLSLEKHSNQVLAGPDIVSRGFVYVRESEDLMEEARIVVSKAVDKALAKNNADWGKIKAEIKDSLSDFIWKKTKRNPMILPIIMEV
ncbi:MAG: ribonuclease J [Clostridiales bacterium]|nr:ribonuclease J [Clostridiales bacterium]